MKTRGGLADNARELSARADLQFVIDVLEVSFDGADANGEVASNFGVPFALSHQTRDLHFAFGERVPDPLAVYRGTRGNFVDEVDIKLLTYRMLAAACPSETP